MDQEDLTELEISFLKYASSETLQDRILEVFQEARKRENETAAIGVVWRTFERLKDLHSEPETILRVSNWIHDVLLKGISSDQRQPNVQMMPKTDRNLETDQDLETQNKDKIIEVQNQMIIKFRRKLRTANIPKLEALREKVEDCRKKNGEINFKKLGKALGVSDKTAKDWCSEYGIR